MRYLLINIVRVTVRFVKSQFKRDCLRFRESNAFQLSTFVHGRGIIGQRDVTQVAKLCCHRGILFSRSPNLKFFSCKQFSLFSNFCLSLSLLIHCLKKKKKKKRRKRKGNNENVGIARWYIFNYIKIRNEGEVRRARNDLASGKPGFQRANSILIVHRIAFLE